MKIEMHLLLNSHTPNPRWQTDTFEMQPGDTLEVRHDGGVKVILAAHPGGYIELDEEEMAFLRSCISAALGEGQGGPLESKKTLGLYRKLGVPPTEWYYEMEMGIWDING